MFLSIKTTKFGLILAFLQNDSSLAFSVSPNLSSKLHSFSFHSSSSSFIFPISSSTSLSTSTTSSTSSSSSSSTSRSSTTNDIPSCLEGVAEFEQWWNQINPSSNRNQLEHASFDSDQLRGLKFSTTQNIENLNGQDTIVSVPRSRVLHTPLQTKDTEMDWDTNLSIQLLEEYSKGKSSAMYG